MQAGNQDNEEHVHPRIGRYRCLFSNAKAELFILIITFIKEF
ncbi:hypothetical protein GCM10011346_27340 [Oceanobacillus neutriphilus]|uniref:Uncharacterized protein n=1 Tax=Oceanobacillus neutriphilus TaxID=531815 RepID=A0ABQ2NWE4_9BACI|nr:hypothetical protein GCM10011346_27340 [Oceanobacillus neutriphilus]